MFPLCLKRSLEKSIKEGVGDKERGSVGDKEGGSVGDKEGAGDKKGDYIEVRVMIVLQHIINLKFGGAFTPKLSIHIIDL